MYNTIKYSPDGALLAVSTFCAQIHILDSESMKTCMEIPYKSPSITLLCWSPDGKRIAYGEHNCVVIIDIAGNAPAEVLKFPKNYNGHMRGLAWSPDGKYIATCVARATFVFTVGSTKCKYYSTNISLGQALSWHPDSTAIAIGGCDGFCIQCVDGYMVGTTEYVNVSSVHWSPDGERIAIIENNRQVKILDSTSLRLLETPNSMILPIDVQWWQHKLVILGDESKDIDSKFVVWFDGHCVQVPGGPMGHHLVGFDWHPSGTKFAAYDGLCVNMVNSWWVSGVKKALGEMGMMLPEMAGEVCKFLD